jgi:hypothetical protein
MNLTFTDVPNLSALLKPLHWKQNIGLNKDDFNKRFNNYITLLLHTLHIIIINIIVSIVVVFVIVIFIRELMRSVLWGHFLHAWWLSLPEIVWKSQYPQLAWDVIIVKTETALQWKQLWSNIPSMTQLAEPLQLGHSSLQSIVIFYSASGSEVTLRW